MVSSERQTETKRRTTAIIDSFLDTYSEPYFFDGRFDTETVLNRGPPHPHLRLTCLLADCSLYMAESLPYLSGNLLSLYNILNTHVIYFRCPLVYTG